MALKIENQCVKYLLFYKPSINNLIESGLIPLIIASKWINAWVKFTEEAKTYTRKLNTMIKDLYF